MSLIEIFKLLTGLSLLGLALIFCVGMWFSIGELSNIPETSLRRLAIAGVVLMSGGCVAMVCVISYALNSEVIISLLGG